ncbi:MAG: CaiB/BaiF CoA-transferase family protein [Oscillospiraceae bacterium]
MKTVFEGVKVLDITNLFAGPYASVYLADMGADVIHIERPQVGDDMRAYTPKLEPGSPCVSFLVGNRGKKSLCLDLADPMAKEILYKLIPEADIIVENYRPGVLDRLGYGYDDVVKVNPSVVYCAISAYGRGGPYSNKGGYDPITQAISGMMDTAGEPDGLPQKNRSSLADFIGGYAAYAQIATAMYHRLKTGEGNFIDVALTDSYVNCNCFIDQVDAGVAPADMSRCGAHEPRIAPWGHYAAAGGERIMICGSNDTVWKKLCDAMNRPDLVNDKRFNNAVLRGTNQKELIPLLEDFLQSFETADAAIAHMDEFGVPCSKIYNAIDVANDPHFLARGTVAYMYTSSDMTTKTFRGRGPTFKLSNCKTLMGVPPALGEHNEEIMKSIGMSEDVIQELNAKWLPKK